MIIDSLYKKTVIAEKKVADQNALLVLENIKVKGFNIGDRANGFNKTDTEAILEVGFYKLHSSSKKLACLPEWKLVLSFFYKSKCV